MDAAMAFHRELAMRGMQSTAAPRKKKRRWPRRVATTLVLCGLTAGGLWFARDTEFVQRALHGSGADDPLLPRFTERPDVRTYQYAMSLTGDQGTPGSQRVTGERVVTMDRELDQLQSQSLDEDGDPMSVTVRRGAVAQESEQGGPWQTVPWNYPPFDTVLMYSDVVDFALRAQPVESIEHDVLDEVPVTVLTWIVDIEDLASTAPLVARGSSLFLTGLDGTVTIVLSFDDQDVVRELDLEADVTDWNDVDTARIVATRYELRELSDDTSSDLVDWVEPVPATAQVVTP
jgi:hypothetical protein